MADRRAQGKGACDQSEGGHCAPVCVVSARFFRPGKNELSLKCEIRRYGRRLAQALPDEQQRHDVEKLSEALEELAEEVERVERRLALIERAA